MFSYATYASAISWNRGFDHPIGCSFPRGNTTCSRSAHRVKGYSVRAGTSTPGLFWQGGPSIFKFFRMNLSKNIGSFLILFNRCETVSKFVWLGGAPGPTFGWVLDGLRASASEFWWMHPPGTQVHPGWPIGWNFRTLDSKLSMSELSWAKFPVEKGELSLS